ncbi:dermonecrotic toxin domain-containing protein [Pseudomonas koreensis]|uniref:dermonecrotic toxin domain-containing protein n=1 Tax=Pseudomonas koreensis TaxID=198620 RepID=UPI0038286A7B
MSRMYTSLMLESLYERVESSVELKKFNAAGLQLMAVLDAIPSFRDMARERLLASLQELVPGLQPEKVFVNRGADDYNWHLRPQGPLVDVYLECLASGLSPIYILNIDGVYDRPNTTDPQYRVSGLRVEQIERLIDRARSSLNYDHQRSLERYWSAIAAPASTYKNVLRKAFASALMAQLSLSVMGGRLELHSGEHAARLMVSGTGRSVYAVRVDEEAFPDAFLTGGFVIDLSNLGAPQLALNHYHYTCVLYTPARGFEFFISSHDVHVTLCNRLSISGNGISYPGLSSDVFEYCVDASIKLQKGELAGVLSSPESVEGGRLAILENIQRLAPLRQNWLAHRDVLLEAVKRSQWPQWLQAVDPSQQQHYLKLEDSLLKSQEAFQRDHAPMFALSAYARKAVANWTRNELGVALDSDVIRVRTRYEMKLAGKTIGHEENRSLTELVTFGAHDPGFAPKLQIEGAENTGLTAEKLSQWMQVSDIRKAFTENLPLKLPNDYRDALSRLLISRLMFDVWVAHHSRQLDRTEFDMVNRALAGDLSVIIAGVSFVDAKQPLRDVLIFQGPRAEYGPQLVYLRNVDGQQGFLRFNQFDEFATRLKEWMSNDPVYAASLLNAQDLPNIGKALERSKGLQWDLQQIRARSVALQREADHSLLGAVMVDFEWAYAGARSVSPLNFRAADDTVRQQHARLSTELKALYTVELRDTGVPSFEVFARQLIKTRIEEVLRDRGRVVEVDPDQIYVQISETQAWVLSELIVQERAFEPPSNPRWDPQRDYPRFHWAGTHPSLDALSIKDIASWSKTLRPGEAYIAMLKNRFQPKDPLYGFKREVYTRRLLGEMMLALTSQYADGQLNNEQYRSLQRLINSLRAPQANIAVDPVVRSESVYAFWIKNSRRVDGVFFFRAMTSAGVEDFLYTPDAPDQIAFRKAADFIWSIRYRAGSLRNYYINRVALVDHKVVNDYFDELQATVTQLPAPAPYGNTRIRDLRVAYDARIRRLIEDVDTRTTSLAEIIGGLIYENVKLAMSVVAIVIPPVGLAVTALEVAKSLYDGVSAHYYGENDKAFIHLKDALLGLVTLGQAGAGAESVSKLQRTFIELVGDADTIVGLLGTALGQELGKERLKTVIQQVLEERSAQSSKTTID